MKNNNLSEFLKNLTNQIIESNNRLEYDANLLLTKLGVKEDLKNNIIQNIISVENELKEYHITIWATLSKNHQLKFLNVLENNQRVILKVDNALIKKSEKKTKENVSKSTENQPKAKVKFAGKVSIEKSSSNIELYDFQKQAIQSLEQKIIQGDKKDFSGLLVLPTGGGKTLTVSYFIARHFLDKKVKVLWIAHRHELLEQALKTFIEKLAYKDILPNKSALKFRLISSLHDRPVKISKDDDIIISSVKSINNQHNGFKHLTDNWLLNNTEELFLIIDEAHHSTAKSYRTLIDLLKGKVKCLKILGLTATPTRTLEKEKGLVAQIFKDDIVYKTDLRTLIHKGILSDPIFEEVSTGINFKLSDDDFDKIKKFDISTIGENIAKTIAEHKERNHLIVQRYLNHKDRYKQTIVFALNVDNAIALNKLFKENKIKSDFVVSDIRDAFTGVSISNQENKEKIHKFRTGELDVLINVNILTEGTDLPKVQTIFLARPTISTILMTQMIGRGLRGVKSGGTEKAYIVSFVDDWQDKQDKIAWVSPEKLFIDETSSFDDTEKIARKQLVRLVSIATIEEFALLTNELIKPELKKAIEGLTFIQRIPKGIYFFKYAVPYEDEKDESFEGDEVNEKICEILVYDNLEKAYQDFLYALPFYFEENNLGAKDFLTERELENIAFEFENEFFSATGLYPAYLSQDIKDIIQFYKTKKDLPQFIEFSERKKLDIDKIAQEIIDKDFGAKAEKEFLDKIWEDNESLWKTLFDMNQRLFIQEVDLAKRKIIYSSIYPPNPGPNVIYETSDYEKMALYEIRKIDPVYEKQLRDSVFKNFTDKDGYYFSAMSGGETKSKNRLKFQIDHIIPMSQGGLTKFDNLQLLTKEENAKKNSKLNSE